jgi:hypothetical protein
VSSDLGIGIGNHGREAAREALVEQHPERRFPNSNREEGWNSLPWPPGGHPWKFGPNRSTSV